MRQTLLCAKDDAAIYASFLPSEIGGGGVGSQVKKSLLNPRHKGSTDKQPVQPEGLFPIPTSYQ